MIDTRTGWNSWGCKMVCMGRVDSESDGPTLIKYVASFAIK